MKSQNVVTGEDIAVLNYQFYCIINFFVSTVQNTNSSCFQLWLAEAAACKSLPPPTCDQQETGPLLLRNAPGHNSHLHELKQEQVEVF